jgi:nitroreductase
MDTPAFEQLRAVIRSRRTTKAVAMNGREIPDAEILQLLELADWAPTHGHNEPWRFYIYGGKQLKRFGQLHGELYWSQTEESKRSEAKRDKLIESARLASHLVITVLHRDPEGRIPESEDLSAVSAAMQNMLLGATALGIASFWSTGGMTYHPAMKSLLGLGDADRLVGLLYLGYSDEPDRKRTRRVPLTEKTFWQTLPAK